MKQSYPFVPATGKTDTSMEAGLSVDAKTWEKRVLDAVREKPSTMSEVATAWGVEVTTVRPRATNLQAKMLIMDSGERRKNKNSLNEIVWKAVPNQSSLFDVK